MTASTAPSPQPALKRRAPRLLAAAVVLGVVVLLGVVGASMANGSGVRATTAQTAVEQGAFLRFSASGLTPNSTARATLAAADGTELVSGEFPVSAEGVPADAVTQLVVPADASLDAGGYRLNVFDRGTGSAAAVVSGLSVVAPTSDARVTAVEVTDTSVRVSGVGFRRANGADSSVVAVLLNAGEIAHTGAFDDPSPMPTPYPNADMDRTSDRVWFYLGPGNSESVATEAAADGFPNPAFASSAIAGGSFTVDIPIESLDSGSFRLDFVTGWPATAPWLTPSATTSPDQPRTVNVSFTK